MGKNSNIIEINGKRYDSRTGATVKHAAELAHQPLKRPAMDIVRHPAAAAKAHAPHSSKTLMRHSVHRAVKSKPNGIKAQGPSELTTPALGEVVVGKSANRVDQHRASRASQVAKSHKIAHFSDIGPASNFQPTPLKQQLSQLPTNPVVAPSADKKSKPKTTAELLEHAIQSATSHEQAEGVPKKRHRGRALAGVVAVLALLVVGYQELPDLKLNVASARAGFSATLPSHGPSGYSLGKLSYSPGLVAAKFTSNSDQRSYNVIQKSSTWDSQALRQNFVQNQSRDYQVVESGGQTFYLYGDGNITWVNGGVWYLIQSGGLMSNPQLVDLAKSM